MLTADYFLYAFLLVGAIASVFAKKLTVPAALSGCVIGLLIYKGAGFTGIAELALFFVTGSWATGWHRSKKQLMNRAEKHNHGRNTGQVLANSGVAAALGAVAWYYPYEQMLIGLMIAGSLASATADTLSSELGTIYGRNFYNILTLKKDERGLDGVVSLEGTLIGIIGTALIAATYWIGACKGSVLWLIVLAGFTGNIADSVLGALLERRGWIGNNTINFLNTLTGALVCLLLSRLAA